MFIQTPQGELVNMSQITRTRVEQTYKGYAVVAYGIPTSSEDFCMVFYLFESNSVQAAEDCKMYLQNLCEQLKAVDTAGYDNNAPSTRN